MEIQEYPLVVMIRSEILSFTLILPVVHGVPALGPMDFLETQIYLPIWLPSRSRFVKPKTRLRYWPMSLSLTKQVLGNFVEELHIDVTINY